MSNTIHSVSPDARVIFYPYEVENTGALKGKPATEFMKTKPLVVQDDLISVSTGKGKGGVGSFTITLGGNQAYKGKINPGCWCIIYISTEQLDDSDHSSPSSGLKMVGIVRSVRRIEQTDSSGRRIVRYQVGGEDFQSIFNTPIYLNSQLAGGGDSNPVAITIARDAADKSIAGTSFTAAKTVSLLLDNLLGPIVTKVGNNRRVTVEGNKAIAGGRSKPILVPSEVSNRLLGASPLDSNFSSMITFFLQKDLPGSCIPIPQIGGVTPIWGLLESFANRITNEMYTELLPVHINGNVRLVPSFILRAIPFSSERAPRGQGLIKFLDAAEAQDTSSLSVKKGINVPVTASTASNFYISKHIEEHEIVAFSSGKSDAERFNFFFVVPNVISGNAPAEAALAANVVQKKGGFNSLADVPSLQRYGLRPYVAYTQYFLDTQIEKPTQISEDLWSRAHIYESGQITLIGSKEHIPVGTNIVLQERGWVAHVERVDHDFSVSFEGSKIFRTSISFSRLQKRDGSPVELTEDLKDIEDGGVESGNQGKWDRGVTRSRKK